MSNQRNSKGASTAPFFTLKVFLKTLFPLFFALCLLTFVLWPILTLLLRSIKGQGGQWTLGYFDNILKQYGRPLFNSAWVGVATALLATLFSLGLAIFVASLKGWQQKVVNFILLLAMVSPPFVSSLSYIQLFGRRGYITSGLLGLSLNPYNAFGVILMQSISFVPMSALFLQNFIKTIDGNTLRSAKDLGAKDGKLLRDILLPLIAPGILASLTLTFIRSLADFGTPIIIGGRFTTLASEIYLQLTGFADLNKAAAMNVLLLLPSLLAFLLYTHFMKQSEVLSQSNRLSGRPYLLRLSKAGPLGILLLITSLLFLVMMVLQYATIFLTGFTKSIRGVQSFSLDHLKQVMTYDQDSLWRSIRYALIVGFAGSIFALFFAYFVQRKNIKGGKYLDYLATLPYMIPGSCFGIAYILSFNQAPLKLTGTAAIILLNMIFKQLPTTTRIARASFASLPKAPELAVQDLGGSEFHILRDITLPALIPTFLTSFAYNFTSSMTTAGAILFLIVPSKKLAVFKLFEAAQTGQYAQASLLASLIIVIVLLVEGLIFYLTKLGGSHAIKPSAPIQKL